MQEVRDAIPQLKDEVVKHKIQISKAEFNNANLGAAIMATKTTDGKLDLVRELIQVAVAAESRLLLLRGRSRQLGHLTSKRAGRSGPSRAAQVLSQLNKRKLRERAPPHPFCLACSVPPSSTWPRSTAAARISSRCRRPRAHASNRLPPTF